MYYLLVSHLIEFIHDVKNHTVPCNNVLMAKWI